VHVADDLTKLHVPNIMKIWEPKSSGNLWATPGLLREYFTFYVGMFQPFTGHEGP